jgi:cell wall-associated NlpC family hydrolase
MMGRAITDAEMSTNALNLPISAASGSAEPAAGWVWALVNRALLDLMSQPAVTSERVSQALLGDVCRILRQEGDWAEVQLERDGYRGWLQTRALHEATEHTARAFSATDSGAARDARGLVVAEIAQAFSSADRAVAIGKLPFGLCLPIAGQRADSVAVRLPDARVWWLAASDILLASERPRADANGVARALRLMQRSVGVPYLWGGCTPFGYDCSGLTQTFWALLGVKIPRDAHQQFQAGQEVQGLPSAGDLIFFSVGGQPSDAPRFANVSHVGISLGGWQMLHASGRARSVAIDHLDSSDQYGAWLMAHLAGVRRFGS